VDQGEIFISYSRRDSGYAKQLSEFLRHAGLPAWMDDQIPTGGRWDRTLQAKIDGCAAFVLVMSPDAEESAWVGEELDRARAKQKPILPLLLAGDVFFGLSRTQYDDVSGGRMPGPAFVARLRELIGTVEPEPAPAEAAGAAGAAGETSRVLFTLDGHTDAVTAVAFSPRGSVIGTGSRDRTVRLVPAQGYGPVSVLSGHSDGVWALGFTSDGRYVVSASEDGMAILWRRSDGSVERALVGHDGPVRTLSVHPRATEVATGSEDGSVRLWSIDGAEVRRLPDNDGPVRAVAYAPDGRTIAVGTRSGAHLRDATGTRTASLDSGDAFATTAVGWSPDSRSVAVAGDDGMVRIHDAITGNLVRTVRCHSGRVYCVAWSPDGRRFATAGLTGVARIWRSANGDLVDTLSGHSGRVFGVAYAPGANHRLATASGDKTTRIWQLA
jgi:WD40 repeat protein